MPSPIQPHVTYILEQEAHITPGTAPSFCPSTRGFIILSEQLNQSGELWTTAERAYAEAERLARLQAAAQIGSLALSGEVSVNFLQEEVNPSTLLYTTQMAALGDKASLAVMRTCIETDVAERLYKSKHQTEVGMQFIDGELYQNGRKLTDVTLNTFRYIELNDVMARRGRHEHGNSHLFNALVGQGVLNTHHIVVMLQTPKDTATRREFNFFEDSDTVSMQMLTSRHGHIYLQTALVAGKTSPEAERHDSAAITKLARSKGVPITINDVDETGRTVFLVPRAEAEGVEDIVKMYDDAAGGTFYGEADARRNYRQFAAECRARDFTTIVNNIHKRLLAEAHLYTTPMEVIQRLDYLSQFYCVEAAGANQDLDTAVFGAEAAAYIEDYRRHAAEGNTEQAEIAIRKAQETAKSGSCPFPQRGKNTDQNSPDGAESKSKKKTMNCPDCNALVYDDPCAAYLKCWSCKASVFYGVKKDGKTQPPKLKISRPSKPVSKELAGSIK